MPISSTSQPVLEGVFAIHKPPAISSFDVIRSLQPQFKNSPLFAPLLARERSKNLAETRTKYRHKRDTKPQAVKIGHGGTLDPIATGVLIIGVGNGTKVLNRFLECTKSYECTVLFGAATDSYDAVGKIVQTAPFQHVTMEMVEQALERFRGDTMQKPPIFSALRVNGKRMYEYAREGGEIPEVKARPVSVTELELVEWMEGGSHDYEWPTEMASAEQRDMARKLLKVTRMKGDGREISSSRSSPESIIREPSKFTLEDSPMPDVLIPTHTPVEKEPISTTNETHMSGALPPKPKKRQPPAAKLRMTVTSGFYVRSLCHDLGLAVGSLGLMSTLVRTRQGDYEVGRNVLDYADLEKGEKVWGPQVQSMLEEWQTKERITADEVKRDDSESEGEKLTVKKAKVHPYRKRRNSSSVEE